MFLAILLHKAPGSFALTTFLLHEGVTRRVSFILIEFFNLLEQSSHLFFFLLFFFFFLSIECTRISHSLFISSTNLFYIDLSTFKRLSILYSTTYLDWYSFYFILFYFILFLIFSFIFHEKKKVWCFYTQQDHFYMLLQSMSCLRFRIVTQIQTKKNCQM